MKKMNFILVLMVVMCQAIVAGALSSDEASLNAIESAAPQDPGEADQNKTVPGPVETDSAIDVLDLKNMDVMDVFRLISQKSGMNIIAGQNVKGRVTVYLKKMDALEALRVIAQAYDWAYIKENNMITVMTAQEYEQKFGHKFGEEIHTAMKQLSFASVKEVVVLLQQIKSPSGKIMTDDKTNTLILMDKDRYLRSMEDIIARVDVPIETKVFELTYARAEEIAKKISESLTSGVGTLKSDERSNRLMVSDTRNKLKEVAAIIEAFDQKDREVLIEAKIVQIALSNQQKLGIDWEAIVADYHELNLVNHFDVLTPDEKRGQLSIGTLSQDHYTALLQTLEVEGNTQILSSPRITAVNNKEAKVLVGSTEPYVTSTVTTPASGPTVTAESVNFIDVGVKLFVTPLIHKDGFITMKIKPEVSSVVKTVTTGSNNAIPVVETSEAETTVMVKDNVTIVIAGLIKEEKIKETKRIPLLGRLPILGIAFRSDNDKVSRTEIAIFLTPKIMTGDVVSEDLPELSSMKEKGTNLHGLKGEEIR